MYTMITIPSTDSYRYGPGTCVRQLQLHIQGESILMLCLHGHHGASGCQQGSIPSGIFPGEWVGILIK